jgi:prephenate dehydrogenase
VIARTKGQVHIIGTGLLGTSVGLSLRNIGVDVSLEDSSPAVQSLAVDFGAGRSLNAGDEVALVVVCVPPDVTASTIISALEKFPQAIVTDVASVKAVILEDVVSGSAHSARYVGSHPMAGREKGGALSGRPDLFIGRPWVVAVEENTDAVAVDVVEKLALDLGATTVRLSSFEHDRAVALISHAPQVVSSLLAARLAGADEFDLALAGQGVRDTTRIAASDPKLWLQILSMNSEQLIPVLKSFQKDLSEVLTALEDVNGAGSLAKIGSSLEKGNQGISRLPGKHGSRNTSYAQVVVMIDDKPGELARLLNEIGAANLNIEDLTLDHATGAQVGLVELSVLPSSEEKLVQTLKANGWRMAG